MNTDTTLLEKLEEMSARVVALEMENRLLRQKLDQYIRHYFGGSLETQEIVIEPVEVPANPAGCLLVIPKLGNAAL